MTKFYSTDPKLPNYARPEYVAREPDLELIADEVAGTRAMHARSTKYIRKWGGEKQSNYNIRRVCETFFEGFGRTLSAATGMLFAKNPAIEWNASETVIAPHWDNIDAAGANGPVFVKRFAESSIRDGFSIIVVDHPAAPAVTPSADNPDGEVTGKMAETFNLRPIWSRYDRRQAINWMVETVDNRATLTQLTLVEGVTVRDGLFGTKSTTRYRDLRLLVGPDGKRVATWTLRELTDNAGRAVESFRVVASGTFRNREGEPATILPVAIGYAGRTDSPMESTMPLLGVAWANLSHWQLATSLRFNSEVAGFAQPTVIGELAKDPKTGAAMALEIGPLVAVQVTEGGSFGWTEAAGTGLERLSLLVQEKLKEMAQQGMSFLQTDTRAAETAEAKRLDATAENATLATAAQGIEDAVNLALEIHAWYVGIEKKDAPVLTISKDFEDTTMPAEIMGAYAAFLAQGMPKDAIVQLMVDGGRLPADTNVEEFVARWEQAESAAKELADMEREADMERIRGRPAA